jgi:parallel beta-helix repeat protein
VCAGSSDPDARSRRGVRGGHRRWRGGGGMTRLLLAAAALVVVLAAAGVGAGATWDVYPGAGTPIQDAIDGAGEGDTIYVHAGTYVENVAVWKRVTLIGDGADVVTVRARDGQDHVFEVIADHVNISGFTLTGAGYAVYASGIYLGSNVDHCNISGNRALNNGCGIYLSYSSNNMLTGNTANSNFNGGIHLSYSSNNMLTGNTANSKYNGGIYLSYSSNNMLTGNNFVDDGLFVEYSYHNSVENNTVNGKPLIYLEDAADYTITNAGQVILVNCNNITVEDLNLSNTIVGIELWGTDNSIITNITANSNFNCGILLYSSSNNMLTGNTANSNNNRGIYLYYSSNNMLTGNTASNNRYGICLFGSSNNNALTDNIFVNDGFFVWSSYHNSAENNTVNGKPLVYLEDVADYTITNAGQVILVNCNNITAEDLNLSNTTIGIELWGTDNSTITNITASNNYYGI